MLKIDNNLLVEVGLGSLPDAEKNGFLKHIYDTLEMRVGIRLADQMTNEQLDEFERYFEAKDDAGAFKWLEINFPNYKEIVQEEFEKLKAEVKQNAPHILSASAAGAPAAQEAPSTPVAHPAAPSPLAAASPSMPSAAPQPQSQPPVEPFQPVSPASPQPVSPVPEPAPSFAAQPVQPPQPPQPVQPATQPEPMMTAAPNPGTPGFTQSAPVGQASDSSPSPLPLPPPPPPPVFPTEQPPAGPSSTNQT